jgi:hypothetical protein
MNCLIKPATVVHYNRHMGHVENADRMANSYTASRRTCKWTKKLFFHPLDVAIVNSFCTSFYRQVAGRKFHTDFRLTVEASTTMLVKEHGYLQVFRNVCFPLHNKGITAFLRHPE